MSSAHLAPVGYQIFINPNTGLPLISGQLFTYQAGTSTPQAAYTDETAATACTNPIVLDAYGGATFWLKNPLGYKLVLEDSNSNLIWTRDNVYSIEPASIGDAQITPSGITPTSLNLSSLTSADLPNDLIENANIQPGAVTGGSGGSIASNTIEASNLDPNIDFTTNLNKMIEVVYRRSDDYTGARLSAVPQFPWSSPVQLSQPATLPPAAGNCVQFSPCGRFLVVGSGSSPYIDFYERNGQTFTKLSDPATLPNGAIVTASWSPNGDFVACGCSSSPYIYVYQRQGSNFTALSSPATIPAGQISGIGWSPTGEFFVAGSTFFSSDTYLIQNNYATLVNTGHVNVFNSKNYPFSGDGIYCFSGLYDAGSLGVTSFASQNSTGGQVITGLAGDISCLDCVYDGSYVAAGVSNNSPYINLFSFSGGTLTQLSNPSTLPTSEVLGCSFSPNGMYLALALASSPYLFIYQRSGSTFTKLADPSTLPAGQCNGVSWSPTGQFLAVATSSSPYVQVYQTASSLPSDAILWARNLDNV